MLYHASHPQWPSRPPLELAPSGSQIERGRLSRTLAERAPVEPSPFAAAVYLPPKYTYVLLILFYAAITFPAALLSVRAPAAGRPNNPHFARCSLRKPNHQFSASNWFSFCLLVLGFVVALGVPFVTFK